MIMIFDPSNMHALRLYEHQCSVVTDDEVYKL